MEFLVNFCNSRLYTKTCDPYLLSKASRETHRRRKDKAMTRNTTNTALDFLDGGTFPPVGTPGPELKRPTTNDTRNVPATDMREEKIPLSKERETQIEGWMANIKDFIKNIDVGRL